MVASSALILDYSQFVEDRQSKVPEGTSGPRQPDLFFSERGWCPFCKLRAGKVYSVEGSEEQTWDSGWQKRTRAWSCNQCGWWEIEHFDSIADSDIEWVEDTVLRHAVLRSFNPRDQELPVEVLKEHLKRHPQTLYSIHPTKMEKLVQSVFSEFYDCEVEHCGRSHDDGIDLILVNSHKPGAIQVKRRESAKSVESVKTVREVLGAMLLSRKRRGWIVTTADHFSSEARSAATRAITLDLVDAFELVDFNRFLDMFRQSSDDTGGLWRRFLPE